MSDDVIEPPLEKLRDAVQEFAQSQNEDPILVNVAIVTWEQVSYDDDGRIGRAVRYAVPTDDFSISAGLGLLEAAHEFVRRDLFRVRDDDA